MFKFDTNLQLHERFHKDHGIDKLRRFALFLLFAAFSTQNYLVNINAPEFSRRASFLEIDSSLTNKFLLSSDVARRRHSASTVNQAISLFANIRARTIINLIIDDCESYISASSTVSSVTDDAQVQNT